MLLNDKKLSSEIEDCKNAFSVFENALKEHQDKTRWFEQQKEDFEKSAAEFREKRRNFLRSKILGKKEKNINELIADEPSACAFSEDYKHCLEELELDLDEALFAVREAANAYSFKRGSVLTLYINALLEDVLSQADPILKFLSLQASLINAGHIQPYWGELGCSSPEEYVVNSFLGEVSLRLKNYQFSFRDDPVCKAIPWTKELSSAVLGPCSMKKEQERLAQTRAKLSSKPIF